MALICKDETMWEPSQELLEKWSDAYPNIDINQELLVMTAWLESNASKRKTSRGMSRFCNSLLSKASRQNGSPMAKDKLASLGDVVKTRDMSSLDDLTHDFTGEHWAFFLRKYGQYFQNGRRFTE